jgi:hypothetical protein
LTNDKRSKRYLGSFCPHPGRTGVLYQDETGKYFIDSELLVGPDFDLVIYADRIRFFDKMNRNEVDGEKKQEILNIALKLLSQIIPELKWLDI